MAMPTPEQRELQRLLVELQSREGEKFRQYFPDTGPLRRELYARHTALMAAGATYKERLFLKANRVGGTECAAYELTCHLTGRYPHWWTGRRFTHPIRAWASGDTMLTVRDIVQHAMLGQVEGVARDEWTGMIPPTAIDHVTRKSGGVPLCVDQVWVQHVSGGVSVLEFKSYDQGSRAFMGTAQHFIWCDEEGPIEVYTECLMRTMTTQGLILCTFTPLMGLTPFLQQFLESAEMPNSDGTGLVPATEVFFPGERHA